MVLILAPVIFLSVPSDNINMPLVIGGHREVFVLNVLARLIVVVGDGALVALDLHDANEDPDHIIVLEDVEEHKLVVVK